MLRVLVLGLAALLTACGSAPEVRTSKSYAVPQAKITRVLFFYQEAEFTSRDLSRRSSDSIVASPSLWETGFYRFGQAMVDRASENFRQAGISVGHASVVAAGEWRPHSGKVFRELGLPALRESSIVVVMPRGGSVRATTGSATMSMAFEVRVTEGATSKPLLQGVIDTKTWNGRDFIARNVEGPRFNEAYADEFLKAVVVKMREAGLI
jgi:hypothetical protein